ncbi:MAG: CHRD domain-containing protein [Steroidobacteraceae bacterium]|jgi:hypothetical protein|nr:CHRD domain-containing protein [Steroidobacteraceae bacterium]
MKPCAGYLAPVVALLLPGTAALAQEGDDSAAGYPFHARLSGAQEVTPPEAPTTPSPGVSAPSAGRFSMSAARDLSSIEFQLDVSNAAGVTAAHLHCAPPGVNGPIVVSLMNPSEQGADVDGVLGDGTRANEDIEASAEGCEELIDRPVRNIASLVAAAAEGLIYANVHTVANPAGEIRGQLVLGEDERQGGQPAPTEHVR